MRTVQTHRYLCLAWLVTLVTPLSVIAQTPSPATFPPTASVAATPAPAAMLPAVTVPATTPPQTNALPPVPVTALPPVPTTNTNSVATHIPDAEANKPTSSMGKSKLSVFFTPVQIRAMREALEEYESRPAGQTQANLEIDLSAKEAPKLVEPDLYPVFYLSSIVYHGPKDWSIWVSGHKITSAKNTTDLTILSVSESQVSFSWTSKFNQAMAKRKATNSFAPIDPIKNRLSKTARSHYDPETGTATFTLGTNQTFNVAYLNTFEGFVPSPKLPALPDESKNADKGIAITDPANAIAPSASRPTPPNQPVVLGTKPLVELIKTPPSPSNQP